MPALVLYGGFRTFVGGDDLRTFTLLAMLLRFIQLVALVGLTAYSRHHLTKFRNLDEIEASCYVDALVQKSYAVIVSYLVISYFLALFGLVLEVGIWRAGAKGTPVQQSARDRLKPLCLVKMFPVSVVRIFALTLGIYSVFVLREVCYCGDPIAKPTLICPNFYGWHGFFAVLIISHFLEIAVVGFYAMFFLTKSTPHMPSFLSGESKWQLCCKCCCTLTTLLTCCLEGGQDNKTGDFADIGMILADFFDGGGHLDIVLSDIMVGLRMLAHQQRLREKQAKQEGVQVQSDEEAGVPSMNKNRRQSLTYKVQYNSGELVVTPTIREQLSRHNERDLFAIAEGARFIRFSTGIYDFKPTVASGMYRFLGGKVAECLSCFGAKAREEVVQNSLGEKNGAGFEIAESVSDKFLQIAGLDQSAEIAYIQFGDGLARTPYFIALDRSWKSVVVAIRGTKGIDDVVADLTIRPESMEVWGNKCNFDGAECYVHAGMLACADWIYNDLETHGLLEKLFARPDLRGYKLRLTGHSLGAGVASILSFLLKDKYPDLRCLCFCPPGCTMSENMADSCKSYLTSYVLDHDIVPRFSLDSMENFRNEMLETVARIKVTKYGASQAKSNVDSSTLVHGKDEIPPSKFLEKLEDFHRYQDGLKDRRETRAVQLHPPGNIVHMVGGNDSERENTSASLDYNACWADKSDLSEIVISSHFLKDHSSLNVMAHLEDIASQFHLSPPFAVDDNERGGGGGISPDSS